MAKCLPSALLVFGLILGRAEAQFVCYIPQVVDGLDDQQHIFASTISFLNLSTTSSAAVVIELKGDDGSSYRRLGVRAVSPPAIMQRTASRQFVLPPGGTEMVGTLGAFGAGTLETFGIDASDPVTAWAKIESTSEIGVVATLQYTDAMTGDVITSTSVSGIFKAQVLNHRPKRLLRT
ncbi:MAG: hypothetical protein ACRD1R_03575 [Acidobacteriota bacterium]